MRARVGAVEFSYVRAIRARLPEFEVRPLAVFRGDQLMVADDRQSTFVVVDHRSGSAPSRPTRVEYWRLAGPAEGALAGMLIFADTATSDDVPAFSALGELTAALSH